MDEHYSVPARKGQITLRAAIRKAPGLSMGDRVAVTLHDGGHLGATVRSLVDATFGALQSCRPTIGEDEIQGAAWEDAAARDERSTRS